MATEPHDVAQRRHEGFTIRTRPEMATNFLAKTRGELVIDIGRQLAKNAQAPDFVMRLSVSSR
jgi:hypothetical protein